MNEIDREIVSILSENSRISITELSKRINLSRPSVSERIEKMLDRGVIEKFTLALNPGKIGRGIIFYINISNLNIAYSVFENILKERKEVLECHRVTGQNNYIIKAATKDIIDMNNFLEELIKYGKIETSIVIDSIL